MPRICWRDRLRCPPRRAGSCRPRPMPLVRDAGIARTSTMMKSSTSEPKSSHHAVLHAAAGAEQQDQHEDAPEHAERRQQRAQLVLPQREEDFLQAVEHGSGRARAGIRWDEVTRPSFRMIWRCVWSATSCSCVTMIMVLPRRWMSLSSDMISCVVLLSSAPVGSSARITFGLPTSARAMATRCFCPPDSWLGMKVLRSDRPDHVEELLGAVIALLAADALVVERQRHVFRGVLERQQVEGLEHEPEHAVAQPRGLGLPQIADRLAGQHVAAGVVSVEHAEDVQQRGLARARRAHDGHQLALADVQVDALEHVQGLLPGAVVLVDVVQS